MITQMRATVRARLLRLAALLLLPGLAISALLTWRVFVTARDGAEAALREAARGLDEVVDREFVQAEVLLRTLAATQELQRGEIAEFDRLARATVVMGGALVLVDQTGQELLDTGLPPGARLPKDAAAPGWAGETAGRMSILPLRRRTGQDSLSAQVVLPVDLSGRHAYDLELVVPARSLQAIVAGQALPPAWNAGIIDAAGTLAARTADPERYVGRRAGADLLAGLASGNEGVRDGTALDGTGVVFAFSRSAHTGWAAAVAAPRALVTRAGLQSTALLALFEGAAILAGLFGARRVARRIAKPVEALAQAARRLGEGSGWTPMAHGLIETDAVARAMAVAAQSLHDRQAALGNLNASLTQRVAARTNELAVANEALDQQRRSLAAILDEMPAGVLVHDPDCTLAFINFEARKLLGHDKDALATIEWPVVRQGGHLLTREQTPTALACAGTITERALLSVACQRGRALELEVSASPLRDAEGRVTAAVTILQDVTARLEAEETRRRSQRLEAVGQLTGGVAHEFNNLLMAVIGCLDLLAKPVASLGDARAANLLANAARAAGRGSRLTTQLLAFSRRQALQMEPLDLNTLVSGMKELLEGTLGRGIEVFVVPEASAWPALADASQVELMLLNLAINARDAMPAGGTLTIRTACVRTGPPGRAEDPPAGEHAVLHVSDTGHGMSPHVLARAFEPFFTTKDVGRGSGLGLPQVLGVAQQMGGGVTIVSREEGRQDGRAEPGGTTVSVFLPRAPEQPAALPSASPELALRRALEGARILLVDDDVDVRVVTRAILEELGALVTEAGSGAAALLALRTRLVDLVLADLTMPHMTGLDLATEVAALAPGLPVVLMTGYGPGALANPGPHIRATLQKPFRADALALALADALGLPAGA